MRDKGLSLVELMVVLLISSLLITAVYSLLRSQQATYFSQDRGVEMQQAMRVCIDRISRDLRMAGYGGNILNVFGNVNGFSNIVTSGNGGQTDSITVLLSEQVATLAQNAPTGSNKIVLTGTPSLLFNTGTKKYLCLNGQNNYLVQGVLGSQVTLATTLKEDHLIGEPVFQVKAVTYKIYPGTRDLVRFENDGMDETYRQTDRLMAKDIENLQFRYTLLDGTVVDSPMVPSEIRDITISLEGRTAVSDTKRGGDGYRRQTLTASIEVRNLAL